MKTSIILKGLVGSHAYGYATEESDKDYMSVSVDDINQYLGIDRLTDASASVTQEVDNTNYELLHFMKLCAGFNPNVIPLLYIEEENYTVLSESGKKIISIRDEFISKKFRNTLFGYAVSQRAKMNKKITGKLGAKRKELIDKFGYDVKAAAHTIRLLKMGIILNVTGRVELGCAAGICKNIRQGIYSYDLIDNMINVNIEQFNDSSNLLSFPDEPNYTKINETCQEIIIRELDL